MEDQNNLTAERSLEIITEQIAQSRKKVSKSVGQSLYIAGICTMTTALIIGTGVLLTSNMAFYLLYFILPFIIYAVTRFTLRKQAPAPVSFVGTMVKKTWITFAIFTLSFYLWANLNNLFVGICSAPRPEILAMHIIHPMRTILLLMGMSVTITGYILKSRWVVWCGIIGGIGGFIWETMSGTETLLSPIAGSISNYCIFVKGFIPGVIVATFAFIGLMLPGLMLKRQK